jgi:hypothetical protein
MMLKFFYGMNILREEPKDHTETEFECRILQLIGLFVLAEKYDINLLRLVSSAYLKDVLHEGRNVPRPDIWLKMVREHYEKYNCARTGSEIGQVIISFLVETCPVFLRQNEGFNAMLQKSLVLCADLLHEYRRQKKV